MNLVLASASPRRRELLGRLGVPFEVLASAVPEIPRAAEDPSAFARRVTGDKARAVALLRPAAAVLAADTIVVHEGLAFGKPADRDDARRMLRELSGHTHEVITAVALWTPDGALRETAACSRVVFRPIEAAELELYLDSGESFDKAGAYAIQGLAGEFVVSVVGSYSNIVGLPLREVGDLLRPFFAITEADEPTRG